MRFLKKICLLLFAAANGAFAQSGETPVLASYSFECKAGDSFIAVHPKNQSDFHGEVSDVGANSISQKTKIWNENCFAGTHYVLFSSGSLKGAWFNILSNDSSSVVLNIDSSEIAKINKSDSFRIIAHWTLNSLFPGGGGLMASEGEVAGVGCSYVFKYSYFDKNGEMQIPEGVNRAVSGVFYYLKNSGGGRWVMKNGSFDFDAGGEIIEPDSFLILRNPQDVRLNICGEVFKSASVLDFKNPSGEIWQENFFASPTLTSVKISSFAVLLENGIMNAGSLENPQNSDFIAVFDNSESGVNKKPSKIYVYDGGWFRLDSDFKNPVSAGGDILDSKDAVIFRFSRLAPRTAKRVKITPDYAE